MKKRDWFITFKTPAAEGVSWWTYQNILPFFYRQFGEESLMGLIAFWITLMTLYLPSVIVAVTLILIYKRTTVPERLPHFGPRRI